MGPPMHAKDSEEQSLHSEILRRIERLNSLVDGPRASAELIGFGPAAIEPLRHFLLSGAPSGIFQPRQWAVEVLAALGAKNVLMDYLDRDEPIVDPIIEHGEDAVRNTAARLMTGWKTDDVFELLLKQARKRILPGIITALGSYHRVETLPIFEVALEDDIARPAAKEALEQFGAEAIGSLVATVCNARLKEGQELPSSLQRRRTAAEILSDSRVEELLWPKLRFLLDEEDPELVVHAAKIALAIAPDTDKHFITGNVLRVLPNSPWYLKDEAAKCLEALFPWSEALIRDQVSRRNQEPPLRRATDKTLITLMRVLHHMGG